MRTKQFDLVEDAILQAYQTNLSGRRRVQIKVDRFASITLIELILGNPGTKQYKYKSRLFRGDEETYAHWLTQEERCPIIAKMLREGYKQAQIAKMLDFHAGTIHKDVHYMREYTTLVDGVAFRARPTPVKRTARRTTSIQPSVMLH
jgi:DNA-binding NarL/FixJ family response regulator